MLTRKLPLLLLQLLLPQLLLLLLLLLLPLLKVVVPFPSFAQHQNIP